jgi:hypothetical protein
VPPGAAVKIEIGDAIFLGEAMYCRATEDGYYVGIELTEVLNDRLEPAAARPR